MGQSPQFIWTKEMKQKMKHHSIKQGQQLQCICFLGHKQISRKKKVRKVKVEKYVSCKSRKEPKLSHINTSVLHVKSNCVYECQ